MRAIALLLVMAVAVVWGDITTGRRGDMLQRYYEQQFQAKFKERKERLSKITTRADALRYQQEVREKLRASFGEFPEKTPLNARITGQIDLGKVLIDKVIFESRPGVEVTGLFYRPKNTTGKIPGIIALCGHTGIGKLGQTYQKLSQSMALRGYGVFMIDPIGQGERHYFDETDSVKRGVRSHNLFGKQLALSGEFFGNWRVWDAIRGLDYLLSRPEIDHTRVGVTGTSGGGTLSTYLNAFDSRLTMAAPGCYITTFMHNLQNELPTDAEQVPPNFIAMGCDMADFLIAAAPRPTMILAQNNDYFDPRGAEEAYAEVRKIYELLGEGDAIKIYIGNGNHGYSLEHRLAAARFFNSLTGLTDNGPESPEAKPLPPEKLYCAPNGLVNRQSFFEAMRAVIPAAPKPQDAHIPQIITDVLKLSPVSLPSFRVARPQYAVRAMRFMMNRYLLETEPGILVTLKQSDSNNMQFRLKPPQDIVLYIPNRSAVDELDNMDLPFNGTVFSLELRGTGESMPYSCDLSGHVPDVFYHYGSDYLYNSCADMLGKPYQGRRVQDVLNTVALLKKQGVKSIHLMGRGMGAITAALAAPLIPEVTKVTLYNAPFSWRQMAAGCSVEWPASTMPRGILRHLDLPDIYRHLKSKEIRLLEPWGNDMLPVKHNFVNQATAP